jgi:hypothetical protein
VTCVVSVLAGLREVIIDAQKVLLDAAIAAGVPLFIPSDYSLDFTKFSDGENRNLDLRRDFIVILIIPVLLLRRSLMLHLQICY